MYTHSGSVVKSHHDSIISLKNEEHYALTPYRFIIAIIYILAANQNILMWAVFNPLQSLLQSAYDESLTYINFATILISNVSYVPANFIANYIIDTYGLRIGTLTGSLLGLIGLWIRCLSIHSFTYVFIGQIFAGFAQPYYYATPQKFSNVWFGIHERPYSTTLMSCSLLIGNCLGPVIPQWLMNLDETDPDVIKSQLQKMMLYAALLGSFVFMLTILFMREKPKIPPSKAAGAEKHNFVKSLKTLLKDRNAMIMILSTSIVNGTLVNYLSVFQQSIQPFGFDSTASGNIISISTGVGLTGSAVGAMLIHKFRKYKLVLTGSSVLSWIILVWNLFAMESGSFVQFCVAVSLYQVAIAPVLPIALEYGVELAFPVGEATIGGIWFVVNQLASTIVSLVVDGMLGNNPTKPQGRIAFVIMIGMQAIATIPMFFVRENLKRAKYEKENLLLERESQKETSKEEGRQSVKDLAKGN